jgi:protein O-GlcNAc transferase
MATIAEAVAEAWQRHQAGHVREAEQRYREVLKDAPTHSTAWYLLGIACQVQGKLEQAVASYEQALRSRPDFPEVLTNLGVAYASAGRAADAIECHRRAVLIKPGFAGAHNNLGLALAGEGHLTEAVACFREALRLAPQFAEAYYNLGKTLQQQGLRAEAAACYVNLGNILSARGKQDDAIACLRTALELCPESVDVLNNLAVALSSLGRLDEAATYLQKALTLAPRRPNFLSNLGALRREQGRIEEALRYMEQALQLAPDSGSMHSNLLVCRNLDPSVEPSALFAEHRHWAQRHASAVPRRPHNNRRDPERRLRIGYSSPDFCRHPVASFVEPIIAQHDARQFEVFCYAELPGDDAVTARFQARAHAWRRTWGLSDEQIAEQIRADGIDILIDLAGHTANNRLGVFSLKPAPVQITYLGYPNTTGLTTIDYRLTDAIADPPDEPPRYSEELVRLPCAFCYGPPEYSPDLTSLPALESGRITFGSMHHLAKLNGQVLDLWCELLKALPSARLLMVRHTLRGSTRDAFHQQLTGRGIAPERFELRAIERDVSYLENYRAIDIALDTLPWSGHTTVCESLWMGVPIITLYGKRYAGRMAASALVNVGLTEWIADSPEKFIEIGVRAASDVGRLSRLRGGLRAQMAASPLCDAASFTHSLEQTYRSLWRRWCDQGSR